MAAKSQLDCDAEGLDGHDGNRANCGTDRDEDERVFLAVFRGDAINHDSREYCDSQAVYEETRTKSVFQHCLNLINRGIGRCMEDNDDGSEQTHGTA